VAVRTDGDPARLAPAFRDAVASLDPASSLRED